MHREQSSGELDAAAHAPREHVGDAGEAIGGILRGHRVARRDTARERGLRFVEDARPHRRRHVLPRGEHLEQALLGAARVAGDQRGIGERRAGTGARARRDRVRAHEVVAGACIGDVLEHDRQPGEIAVVEQPIRDVAPQVQRALAVDLEERAQGRRGVRRER